MALLPNQIVLYGVRIAFAQQMYVPGKAKSAAATAAEKYNFVSIIQKDSENDKKVRAGIMVALQAKFKDGAEAVAKKIRNNSGTCCYLEGDDQTTATGKVYDGFAGNMALKVARFKDDGPITIVNKKNQPVKPGDKDAPYGGCFANIIVRFRAYDNVNRGVACDVDLVQFAADGDSFGGAPEVDPNALPAIEGPEDSQGFDDPGTF